VLLLILIVEELVSEDLNVFLNLDEELNLIFLDSASDSGPGEEGVEDLEHPEHFVGILGLRELGFQDRGDLRLDFVDLEVVCSLGLVPEVESLLTDV